MNVFDTMLSRYEIKTNDDYTNALHEVMQQIALAGLYRGGFFEHAAFYGGTCLRIFHQLERFSQDMDFSLLQTNKQRIHAGKLFSANNKRVHGTWKRGCYQ